MARVADRGIIHVLIVILVNQFEDEDDDEDENEIITLWKIILKWDWMHCGRKYC